MKRVLCVLLKEVQVWEGLDPNFPRRNHVLFVPGFELMTLRSQAGLCDFAR